MQHEHMPFCIIIIRFASMAADVLSSHVHVMRIPPAHFSMAIVHRGAIIMPGIMPIPIIIGFIIPDPPIGIDMGMFIMLPIGMPIPVVIPRSVIIPVVMANS